MELWNSWFVAFTFVISGYIAMYYWTEVKRFIRVFRFYLFMKPAKKERILNLRDEILTNIAIAKTNLKPWVNALCRFQRLSRYSMQSSTREILTNIAIAEANLKPWVNALCRFQMLIRYSSQTSTRGGMVLFADEHHRGFLFEPRCKRFVSFSKVK